MTSKPNDVRVSRELLPCPFCGTAPTLPDGDGTQYEIECDECGQASSSVQICDLMTIEERATDEFKNYRYGEEFVERAKLEAIKKWNTRAQPADQQGEPVRLTAVAVLRDDGDGGLQPDWLLEGGTAELWDGAVLIVADEHPELCEEDGNAELYRHAQPATAKVDERAEFERWYLAEYYEGDKQCGLEWLSTEPCGGYRYAEPAREWKVWQARAKLNTPQ